MSAPSRTTRAWCSGVASVEGQRLVELGLLPVAALGLVEDDRVVGGDRLLDHEVGVDRVGAHDDLEAGGVREVGLVRLAVVLDRADAATDGDADDDRQADLAQGAGAHLRQLADDLVERRVDEAVELDLADRPVAAQRQADRRADDARLGERGVDDPVLAEVLLQPVGDPEDAAELADVLAHDEDLRVGLHGLAQAHVDALGQRDLRHVSGSPRTCRGRPRTAPAPPRAAGAARRRRGRRCDSGSGSGISRQPSRTWAASSSDSFSSASKNAWSA